MLRRQFDTLYREGETIPRVMAIVVHPFVTGQPHRIGALDAKLVTGTMQRRRSNASRNAGLFSIPSALALMFAKPMLMSLAQCGIRPSAEDPRCARWAADRTGPPAADKSARHSNSVGSCAWTDAVEAEPVRRRAAELPGGWLGRPDHRPLSDLLLFAEETINFRLQFLGAILPPACRCLSEFDKPLDQQILDLNDPGPFFGR